MLAKDLQPFIHTGEPNERTKTQPSETTILHLTYEKWKKFFVISSVQTGLGHTQDPPGKDTANSMTHPASNSPSTPVQSFDFRRGKIFYGASRPNA